MGWMRLINSRQNILPHYYSICYSWPAVIPIHWQAGRGNVTTAIGPLKTLRPASPISINFWWFLASMSTVLMSGGMSIYLRLKMERQNRPPTSWLGGWRPKISCRRQWGCPQCLVEEEAMVRIIQMAIFQRPALLYPSNQPSGSFHFCTPVPQQAISERG